MIFRHHRQSTFRSITFALATGLWINLNGCATTVTPPDGGGNGNGDTTVSFSTQVQPIFTSNCAGCHSSGGIDDLFGIELRLTAAESFAKLVNQPSVQDTSLTIVIPGDSASSLIIAKIDSGSPPVGARMPLFGPVLSQSQIDLIKNWIDQGAMNN